MDSEKEIPESTLTLPISRIKKIIKMDSDHVSCSDSATYLLGVATELFVKSFVEVASGNAKIESRKKITYQDFSKVVRTFDNLAFLNDTVPPTIKVRDLIETEAAKVSQA
ncbi:BA75_02541T0 [Komagataella pastoris]|uniref:BA75_02541T0 n=1 Tax=Komagataella pastoris TaxID=4922 RepID=A0A1B2JBW0_PICPA|nr:BA75_02541T0 [Komagataella pastoris]